VVFGHFPFVVEDVGDCRSLQFDQKLPTVVAAGIGITLLLGYHNIILE
jgi:hypothetical protein